MRSGWCTSPPGARPQHERCRSVVCSCECGHPKKPKPLIPKGNPAPEPVDSEAVSGPASTGIDRGPEPTTEESIHD